MMPATYREPGVVAVNCEPQLGMLFTGRYPGGEDAADARLAALCEAADIAAYTCPDVMAWKYGKLLMNLNNVLDAALGPGADRGDWPARIRAEAEAVFAGAGIAWKDVSGDPRRARHMRPATIPGSPRAGSSTSQSLARGTGSVETAFLNGEIVLLARQAGTEAPLNARAARLGAHLAANGAAPGAMDLDTLAAWLSGTADAPRLNREDNRS